MEKKDLVIGRKYLHKENREVYYLGESKMGDSIVQPTNGINGIVSLKASHPELKDIIGNDKFWGYFNVHLELSEIEPKYLTVNELVDGEIYFGKHIQLDVIFIPNKCEIYDNRNFYKGNSTDGIKEITEANQEQKDWLNACIKANKFVPKDYVEEIPEYVECIKCNDNDFTVGKIYKFPNPIDDDGDERSLSLLSGCFYGFIPSTKDAFEAQNKVKENTFEVGRWYSFDWEVNNSIVICKVSSVNNNNINISWRKYLNDGSIDISDGYFFKHISNIKELSIEEIRQYLPEGHPDKVVKEFVLPEKWCIKPKNENQLELIYNYGANEYGEGKDCAYYYHYPEFKLQCFARDYITTGYTEITFEQFQKYVLKQEEKPIEKWSVGSYVVFLCDYGGNLKGTVDKIIADNNERYIKVSLPYNGSSHCNLAKDSESKWFATLEEAQEFSDTLKNKKTMNYKFKVGDKVKVVKVGLGVGYIPNYSLIITSLGTYSGKPGYSVEPKIGNSFSGTCNGMIGEESFELYKEEEWAPQVGEYAVMVKAGGFGYHPVNNGCIAKITKVYKDINGLYVISGEILNPNKKTNNYFQNIPIWWKDYGVICRKALPHEIPSQVMKAKEFNFEEFLYEEPAFNPFIKQYPLTPREAFKPNGLDLSLRDEKEINVNEIKTSNNNISKLNLSLNN